MEQEWRLACVISTFRFTGCDKEASPRKKKFNLKRKRLFSNCFEGKKWKWRNDRRSERNFCNCVKKPEKNSGNSGFSTQLHKLRSLWRSFLHFHFISAVHIWFISYIINTALKLVNIFIYNNHSKRIKKSETSVLPHCNARSTVDVFSEIFHRGSVNCSSKFNLRNVLT